MNPKEFENKLHQLVVSLQVELPRINEKMALNAYALLKDRLINDGVDSNGKSLGQYSDNKLPAFYYTGKSANKGGDEALAKALNKENEYEGISYKEWRQSNNRPVDHVTLSFTGTTLNDVGVTKQTVEGNKVSTSVGAKNTKTRANGKSTSDILGYLVDRYGNILQPNAEEAAVLQRYFEKEIQLIINKTLK